VLLRAGNGWSALAATGWRPQRLSIDGCHVTSGVDMAS
jgi:hypothetical protein